MSEWKSLKNIWVKMSEENKSELKSLKNVWVRKSKKKSK